MNADLAQSEDAINQREWEQPMNWSGWFGAYSSKVDTRLWVPKRPMTGTGFALNFGHPAAKVTFAAMCTVPAGLLLLFALLQFVK
jgi:uncharacterized membrane protein